MFAATEPTPAHGDTHGHGKVCKPDLHVMGALLQGSGPFLFPCTIEYSLICAAILYMMWKNVVPEHEHYTKKRMRKKISIKMHVPLPKVRLKAL